MFKRVVKIRWIQRRLDRTLYELRVEAHKDKSLQAMVKELAGQYGERNVNRIANVYEFLVKMLGLDEDRYHKLRNNPKFRFADLAWLIGQDRDKKMRDEMLKLMPMTDEALIAEIGKRFAQLKPTNKTAADSKSTPQSKKSVKKARQDSQRPLNDNPGESRSTVFPRGPKLSRNVPKSFQPLLANCLAQDPVLAALACDGPWRCHHERRDPLPQAGAARGNHEKSRLTIG